MALALDMASHGGAEQQLARAPPSMDENWFRVHQLFLIPSRELQVWFYLHLFMSNQTNCSGVRFM
jgi:hypothetical protein